MQISDVQRLATLARLEVSKEEQESLLQDLTAIVGYIDQVTKAELPATSGEAPEFRNITREDVVTTETGIYTESLLAQASDTKDGYIKVKKIL